VRMRMRHPDRVVVKVVWGPGRDPAAVGPAG
jgi:hypothetical protein